MSSLPAEVRTKILAMQKGEMTEHFIYQKLSQSVKNPHNKEVLRRIAKDELGHHNLWLRYTGEKAHPSRIKTWLYYVISRVFGLTFGQHTIGYDGDRKGVSGEQPGCT